MAKRVNTEGMRYPSVDKLLDKVDSKYKLAYIAAKRAKIIEEEDYITRIAGRLTYQEQDTRTKLHILTEDLNRYLEMPAVSVKE